MRKEDETTEHEEKEQDRQKREFSVSQFFPLHSMTSAMHQLLLLLMWMWKIIKNENESSD